LFEQNISKEIRRVIKLETIIVYCMNPIATVFDDLYTVGTRLQSENQNPFDIFFIQKKLLVCHIAPG
jgi:hypothetical protein